jgi:hypothetical protein
MLLSGGAITTSERYRSAQDVWAIFPKANEIVLGHWCAIHPALWNGRRTW